MIYNYQSTWSISPPRPPPHSPIVSIKVKPIFFFQLQRGEYRVRYDNRVTTVHLTTVNMSTQLNTAVKANVNTTNNYKVELEQNGGMTVVGDNANINNYHQPPQN